MIGMMKVSHHASRRNIVEGYPAGVFGVSGCAGGGSGARLTTATIGVIEQDTVAFVAIPSAMQPPKITSWRTSTADVYPAGSRASTGGGARIH